MDMSFIQIYILVNLPIFGPSALAGTWMPFGEYTYFIEEQNHFNRSSALEMCERKMPKAQLAWITTENEHNFTQSTVTLKDIEKWIGLQEKDGNPCIPTEQNCSNYRERWQWSDGSAITLNYWVNGEPGNNEIYARLTKSGWAGKEAEYLCGFICKRHMCDGKSCAHGGSCLAVNGTTACVCLVGFTGPSCETDVDDCSSSPCGDNGRCQDGVNSFSCTCDPGYTGTTCETAYSNPSLSPGSQDNRVLQIILGITATTAVLSLIGCAIMGYYSEVKKRLPCTTTSEAEQSVTQPQPDDRPLNLDNLYDEIPSEVGEITENNGISTV